MKKPRKPEVVEVRFRLLTAATNVVVKQAADAFVQALAININAKLTKRPTVERVGKR